MARTGGPGRLPAFEIYCRVVDNFGDAGVCWRLARQLAVEHGAPVTLLIDRPETLRAIAPGAEPGRVCVGVKVLGWPEAERPALPALRPTDDDRGTVLVSAFGCELPPAVRRRLADPSGPRTLWVNLEYLSAESWIEGCHGLRSTKPSDGAVEHFFYPGFTPATGGLLRERGLVAARDAFLAHDGPAAWLDGQGLAPVPGERLVSLFCYPDAPAAALFASLAEGAVPTRLLLPEGTADAAVERFLGAGLPVGDEARRGRLTLRRFALLDQDGYDRLLWSCDLNFVRGEDSWIRAHWAGRPFVWQPYRQPESAHQAKLSAFLERFESVAGPIPEIAGLMRAWSGEAPVAPAWSAFAARIDDLPPSYRRWSAALAAQRDLASCLLEFCADRL